LSKVCASISLCQKTLTIEEGSWREEQGKQECENEYNRDTIQMPEIRMLKMIRNLFHKYQDTDLPSYDCRWRQPDDFQT
jgi:hypothetical protein